MSPDRYQRIKEIFQTAVELPPAHRSQYLDSLCRGDQQLRAEVDFLLASDDCAHGFLKSGSFVSVAQIYEQARQEETHPRRIGPYEVLSVVGSGGMGTVYRAARADDVYRKQVAIKLVRKGMESEAIVRRFRREREILASLEHPNIAQLQDGGSTEDGRPYFVMEWVEGVPIHKYCEQRRLGTRDRLRLFLTVCRTVAFAHRNLVVHRDLKPGNILVKDDGTVKLLDFGIAKVLHPDPQRQALERTATSLRILTPQYASPEQVRGDPVTTATDVYLLGMILYELLTGHRPFRLFTADRMEALRILGPDHVEPPSAAILRTVVEQNGPEPVVLDAAAVSRTRDGSPRKLRRSLRGDVDSVLLKALARDPAARYSSAEQFADDLQNHLDHRPVQARKQTLAYVAGKFIQRNTGAVITAALVFVLIVAAAVAVTWQSRLARQQLELAEQRSAAGIDLACSIVETPAVPRAAVEQAVALLDTAGAGQTRPARMAQAYWRAGERMLDPDHGFADAWSAVPYLLRALSLYEAAGGAPEVASLKAALAEALSVAGERYASLRYAREAVRALSHPGGPPAARSRAYTAQARALLAAGLTQEAAASVAMALESAPAGLPRADVLMLAAEVAAASGQDSDALRDCSAAQQMLEAADWRQDPGAARRAAFAAVLRASLEARSLPAAVGAARIQAALVALRQLAAARPSDAALQAAWIAAQALAPPGFPKTAPSPPAPGNRQLRVAIARAFRQAAAPDSAGGDAAAGFARALASNDVVEAARTVAGLLRGADTRLLVRREAAELLLRAARAPAPEARSWVEECARLLEELEKDAPLQPAERALQERWKGLSAAATP